MPYFFDTYSAVCSCVRIDTHGRRMAAVDALEYRGDVVELQGRQRLVTASVGDQDQAAGFVVVVNAAQVAQRRQCLGCATQIDAADTVRLQRGVTDGAAGAATVRLLATPGGPRLRDGIEDCPA
jgi:hypothetical protein